MAEKRSRESAFEGSFGTKGGDESSFVPPLYEPRLADPARSRAVLIDGFAEASSPMPALASRLADPALWGLPEPNIRRLTRPSLSLVMSELRSAAAESHGALLVCFRGQAIPAVNGDWLLALNESETATTADVLAVDDLMDVMAGSHALPLLLVLDCSARIEPAYFSPLGPTVFQAAIADFTEVLHHGDPAAPELLDLRRISAAMGDSVRVAPRGAGFMGYFLVRNMARRIAPSHHVPWQHDTPAARDLLQREALARILGKRLRQVTAEAPDISFLEHLDGQWGAGKSTLLNLLAKDLGDDFVVVPFNAWRHSRVEPTWYPLLTAVRDRVVRSRPWYHFRFLRLRETWMRIRYAGASWMLPMAVTTAVIIAGVLALRASWDPARSGALVSVVGPALAVAGLIWGASRVASRLLLWDSARGARIFEQSHTDPMGEVAHHFAWMLRRSRRPVVIFIDDLDRCDRATVVETLEVVQNLIRESPSEKPGEAASFIVSADGAWLRCAFEGHFEDFKSAIDEPGRPLGYLFQDKLFQLSVPLRFLSAEQQSSYVASLLTSESGLPVIADTDAPRRIAAATTEAEVVEVLRDVPAEVRVQVAAQAAVKMAEPDIRRSTEHALLKFAHLLQPNPRGIKRFLNTYTVLRTLRTLEAVAVDVDTLAAWAVIRSRWPKLADDLEARPELLDEPEGWAGELDGEVRAFLAALPSGLSSGDVRACCGNRPGVGGGEAPPPT